MTIITDRAVPAGTSAEIYQRLRSHLAFLKMGAAAEALPGVLDAARDTGTSPLEAIERLLAIGSRLSRSAMHSIVLIAPSKMQPYCAVPIPWKPSCVSRCRASVMDCSLPRSFHFSFRGTRWW